MGLQDLCKPISQSRIPALSNGRRLPCVEEPPALHLSEDCTKGSESCLHASDSSHAGAGDEEVPYVSIDGYRVLLRIFGEPSKTIFSTILQNERDGF